MLIASQNALLVISVLIPLLPLLGAVIVGLLGSRLMKGASHWPVILGVAGSLVLSLILLAQVGSEPPDNSVSTFSYYSWIVPGTGVPIYIKFRVDALTAIMLATVCCVSLLVVIYSRDYMREDHEPERGYERFFAFLGLFVFSMCTLVLAGDFVLLYLGWEAVGLCSYLLIGFYYQRPSAARAAKKAFVVTRIGDLGFGLGILLLYRWILPYAPPGQSPLDYTVVFEAARNLTSGQSTAVCLLLFAGAVGKSAQLPLYVWLPDAMEGPSPVSALIHAATMVTAGVYMVVRCGPIFVNSQVALDTVAIVGTASSLYAAIIAIGQYDMKRILAYSTISQLGYMFMGAGVLAADAAIFHLFTHAFFKSLLFLGAGSVMHAMGGIIDARRFGGLRRVMPITFATFIAASLALSGFPFFSGFFSKDAIIHAAYARSATLGIIGLVTAVLTAYYTFRMVFMAFFGEKRVPEGVDAHESGYWMLVPMVLLSIGAVFGGYLGVSIHAGGYAGAFGPNGWFQAFLAPIEAPFKAAMPAGVEHGGEYVTMYISSGLAVLGIAVAYVLYVLKPAWAQAIREGFPRIYAFVNNKFYVDEAYDLVIVRPLWRVGKWMYDIDRFIIDNILWLIAYVPQTLGSMVRVLQNGAVQGYGVVMTGGLVLIVLIAWLIW